MEMIAVLITTRVRKNGTHEWAIPSRDYVNDIPGTTWNFRPATEQELKQLRHQKKQMLTSINRDSPPGLIQTPFVSEAIIGWTPLHTAARDGDIEAVNSLAAKYGTVVNAKDTDGRTPLHWASEGGHTEVVR